MNRYINALFTKHKKKHLPKFLQGTWFDEWMSYGYITFITSFLLQGMLYANWRDNVIKIGMDNAFAKILMKFDIPFIVSSLVALVAVCISYYAIVPVVRKIKVLEGLL